jgi:acyl-CoA thioester hydrolase
MKEHELKSDKVLRNRSNGSSYHGNYAQYFEMGRVEWLRNLGISINGWKKMALCSRSFF